MILAIALLIIVVPAVWMAWALAMDFGWGNVLAILGILIAKVVWWLAVFYVGYRIGVALA